MGLFKKKTFINLFPSPKKRKAEIKSRCDDNNLTGTLKEKSIITTKPNTPKESIAPTVVVRRNNKSIPANTSLMPKILWNTEE